MQQAIKTPISTFKCHSEDLFYYRVSENVIPIFSNVFVYFSNITQLWSALWERRNV